MSDEITIPTTTGAPASESPVTGGVPAAEAKPKKPETRTFTVLLDRGVKGFDGKLQKPVSCGGTGTVELEPGVAAPLLAKGYLVESAAKKKS